MAVAVADHRNVGHGAQATCRRPQLPHRVRVRAIPALPINTAKTMTSAASGISARRGRQGPSPDTRRARDPTTSKLAHGGYSSRPFIGGSARRLLQLSVLSQGADRALRRTYSRSRVAGHGQRRRRSAWTWLRIHLGGDTSPPTPDERNRCDSRTTVTEFATAADATTATDASASCFPSAGAAILTGAAACRCRRLPCTPSAKRSERSEVDG
jgi:hypothetical protein